MSENRDTRAIFSVSHFEDEFALICRAICFSKVRFSLAFHRRNLIFFPWNLAWNSLYIVEKPINLTGATKELDCEQSLFFVRFSEGSALARETGAAVSRVLLDRLRKKRDCS